VLHIVGNLSFCRQPELSAGSAHPNTHDCGFRRVFGSTAIGKGWQPVCFAYSCARRNKVKITANNQPRIQQNETDQKTQTSDSGSSSQKGTLRSVYKDKVELVAASVGAAVVKSSADAVRADSDKNGKKQLTTDEQKRTGARDIRNQDEANQISESMQKMYDKYHHQSSPIDTSDKSKVADLPFTSHEEYLKSKYKVGGGSDLQFGLSKDSAAALLGDSPVRNVGGSQILQQGGRLNINQAAQNANAPHRTFGKSMISDEPASSGTSSDGEAKKSGSVWKKAADWAETIAEKALDVLGDETGVSPPGGNEASTILNAPKVVEEVTGDSKDFLNGFKAIFADPWQRDDMPHKFDQPKRGDDGGGSDFSGPVFDDSWLPEQLRMRNILQGVTGKGSGGGETVNPGEQGNTGDSVNVDLGIKYRTKLTEQQMIGQPLRNEETGDLTGGSGGAMTDPVKAGGAVDPLEGDSWTGTTRTEEPGDVQTTRSGDLSGLFQASQNDDDDYRKKSS